MINAILDSYRMFLDETYRNMGDDTVKLIAEARQVLKDDLEKREVAYRAFREKSPMLWKGKEEVNPLQDRLGAYRDPAVGPVAPQSRIGRPVEDDRKCQEGRQEPRRIGGSGL